MTDIKQVVIKAPSQQEHLNPTAMLDTGDLTEWLGSLPLLKPIPTVQQIIEIVTTLNAQQISVKKRQQLLDAICETALKIYPSLNPETLARLSIKETARNQIHIQTTQLCTSTADGYKIIIRDAINNDVKDLEDVIFLPLYHAIELLSLALLSSYRNYKATPVSLYHDIHQLYLLAELTGLLDLEAERGSYTLSADTIGQMYRQIMILAFLDPFHMPPGMVEKLYERLAQMSQYCTILSRVPDPDAAEIFIADLYTDEAPRAIYKVSEQADLKMPRVFDTKPLLNKIRADITLLQSEDGSPAIKNEMELLQRLIPPDKEQVTRKSERKETRRVCRVTFGIDAVYHFLNLEKNELEQVLQSDADNFGNHTLESWTIINESTEGYSLCNQATTRHDVRVGDIVGLLTEEAGVGQNHGKIAVIRWMQHSQNDAINMGLEIIAGNILPAMCRLLDAAGTKDTCAGIFISSNSATGMPATLITPKMIYRRGRIMEVTIGEQPMKIEAGYLRDDTFTYDLFDFISLDS